MYRLSKRALDLSLSAIALAVLSPLLAVLALAIKMHDGGPVVYAGRRVGKGGKPFLMYKFRSMVLDADRLGGSSTPDDDRRITRVGRFLRRYKLDELPQLVNVVKGDMSLVGPRPQVQWAVDLYSREEREVLTVAPGLTDYASVRFPNEGELLRGSVAPDRDYMEKIHPEKMRLSLEYVRNRSLLTDFAVIARTAIAIFR
jgi:lipopolysaccharide/colanic/teichoic acid biosynthesis glycosyltransferase